MASSKKDKGSNSRERKPKSNITEQIKDIYYKDLPSELQKDLMEIHKMISAACHDEWQNHNYDDIRNSGWAKSMYDEFMEMPMGERNTGSARLYKKKNRYSCMIQITGHVPNNREDINHELFHEFIRSVHQTLRPKVRRKFDMALVCESEHGEHFEGFDVWPKQKVAKMLWEKFPDVKVIEDKPYTDKEVTESVHDYMFEKATVHVIHFDELPRGLRKKVSAMNFDIARHVKNNAPTDMKNTKEFKNFLAEIAGNGSTTSDIGYTEIRDGHKVTGTIIVIPDVNLHPFGMNAMKIKKLIKAGAEIAVEELDSDITKHVKYTGSSVVLELIPEYAEKLLEYAGDNGAKTESYVSHVEELDESICTMKDPELKKTSIYKGESVDDDFTEAATSMATNAMTTIVDIGDIFVKRRNAGSKNNDVSQSWANAIAITVTKGLLSRWAPGYREFNIHIAGKPGIVEFKLPRMDTGFVSRYVKGRENVRGFLRQDPTITMVVAPDVFMTMRNGRDLLRFVEQGVKYYSSGIEMCSDKFSTVFPKLKREVREAMGNTKLSGVIAAVFRMFTTFEDVRLNKKKIFDVSNEDIDAVASFVKRIGSEYPYGSRRETQEIIKKLKGLIDSFNESTSYDKNLTEIRGLAYAIDECVDFILSDEWKRINEVWMCEQVDIDKTYHHEDPAVAYLQEANKIKRLKKIPRDLVAYITIEAESIRDANDKMMIASYCLGKLDIVEWYIELIDTNNPKYVVPHTRPYLVELRTQLLDCYKNIMATKLPEKKDRPYIDVKYPPGYEG